MPQLLVRDLSEETVKRLKIRAKKQHRSLQGEVKLILEGAALQSMEGAKEMSEKIRAWFADRTFSDSAELIHQDRKR
jgi:antitoxin FitA